jgi:hypothetical protein
VPPTRQLGDSPLPTSPGARSRSLFSPAGARDQPEGWRASLWTGDVFEDVLSVAPVLGSVGSVDIVVIVVSLGEGDVLVDTPGSDVTFMALLDTSIPVGRRAVHRADVEIVPVRDNPDGPGAAQFSVGPQ